MTIDDTILGTGREILSVFFDPLKRVYWIYLLSAGVIAFLWLIIRRKLSISGAVRKIFSKASWWNKSARADYCVMAVNSVVMSVLSPRLLGQTAIAYLVFEWMHQLFAGRPQTPEMIPAWAIMVAFTLCLFILDDLARYIVHRMLHRIPVLWAFHKVHHSATALNPLTVFRMHPVEGILFAVRGSLVQGITIAVFVFFFGSQVQLLMVFGAGVFNWMFNAFLANLRHSHIQISFWKPVERIFISPAQHQIHHSISEDHRDKNFGVALAIWDWMFNSHCFSSPDEELTFGLSEEINEKDHRLTAIYLEPFAETFRFSASLIGRIRGRRRIPLQGDLSVTE